MFEKLLNKQIEKYRKKLKKNRSKKATKFLKE